jgi:hypothetical protein
MSAGAHFLTLGFIDLRLDVNAEKKVQKVGWSD